MSHQRLDKCTKTLPCGHSCNGVQGEDKCLPCLCGCKTAGQDNNLTQNANDNCVICSEKLSTAPCIQIDCGHVLHYNCCDSVLQKRWSGTKISFCFMQCYLCRKALITHPKLKSTLDPINELCEDVKKKCLVRLDYDSKNKCDALTNQTSQYYQKPFEYAMSIYCYYVCFKCKKPYYGGEKTCVGQGDECDPKKLVCPECSDVPDDRAKVCDKHGKEYLQYKCRYCCSLATFFCFGTTHFCAACHNDHSRLTSMKPSELPKCPVAPCAKSMEGKECPLRVQHPPTGEEFILGCGICRNAQTF